MRIAHQRAAADDLAVHHRKQTRDGAALDLLDPGGQDLRLADVARQEQQIMRRKRLAEGEHGGLVGGRHQADLDVSGIRPDATRIGTRFTHVDLFPSQESSFGHSRFTALAPASRPWPRTLSTLYFLNSPSMPLALLSTTSRL